jgi:hypothetical protein
MSTNLPLLSATIHLPCKGGTAHAKAEQVSALASDVSETLWVPIPAGRPTAPSTETELAGSFSKSGNKTAKTAPKTRLYQFPTRPSRLLMVVS